MFLPQLLMVGGNARHAGKTTLACGIIRKFSGLIPMVGVKVTRIQPEEGQFHGKHDPLLPGEWRLKEETDSLGDKDTSRLLRAGADRVFFIQAYENGIERAFHEFLERIGKDALIICESRNLRNYVHPGIYILMIREIEPGMQKDLTKHLPLADIICQGGNDQEQVRKIISRISIRERIWKLD